MMFLGVLSVVTASLLSAGQHVVTAANSERCPSDCRCYPQTPAQELTIDCEHRRQRSSLSRDIDDMLMALRSADNLTKLTISNASLTEIPLSVCRLTSLTQLSVSKNNIVRLQREVIECLTNVTFLDLSHNSISYVNASLLANISVLPRLGKILLNYNRLTELEPWPFVRGRSHSNASPLVVDLSHNSISTFNNTIGFWHNCSSPISHVTMNIGHNAVRHLSDMFMEWGIYRFVDIVCLKRGKSHYQYDNNPFVCDCVDLDFYRWSSSTLGHSPLFDDCYCSEPLSLYNRQIATVPLDQFQCNFTYDCPEWCRCYQRPYNWRLLIDCSSADVTSLPVRLPALPKTYTKYVLNFSGNARLTRIESRDYFAVAVSFDASNSAVDSIDPDAWLRLVQLSTVRLDGNRFRTLPQSFALVNVSTTSRWLHLGNNPWSCACDQRWMRSWLTSLGTALADTNDVRCASPRRLRDRNIVSIPEEEFCVDPVGRAAVLAVSAVCAALTTVLAFVGVAYRLRLYLFTRWKLHPFSRDECAGERMVFDVFVSCSSEDHEPHGVGLVRLIEERGYRVCYHLRDFAAGALIEDNILYSVKRSKRTVCLLSERFLRSHYCLREFEVALHHNITTKRMSRLIVLMMVNSSSVFEVTDDDPTKVLLRQYIRQYTYIDHRHKDWFQKLLYALPIHSIADVAEDRCQDDDELISM